MATKEAAALVHPAQRDHASAENNTYILRMVYGTRGDDLMLVQEFVHQFMNELLVENMVSHCKLAGSSRKYQCYCSRQEPMQIITAMMIIFLLLQQIITAVRLTRQA